MIKGLSRDKNLTLFSEFFKEKVGATNVRYY